MRTPLVGITCDVWDRDRTGATLAYVRAVARAGALPVLIPPLAEHAADYARLCDAFVFTGGDDPAMEPFGGTTDPRCTLMDPKRQEHETALLRTLQEHWPDKPVLGVCLGMQMMALVAGGDLHQHLPDVLPTAAEHWERDHAVVPEPDGTLCLEGLARSRHRQAVRDPGHLRVLARAPDGTIEAVRDPARAWYVGVQWHPERTEDKGLGGALFAALVAACDARCGQAAPERRRSC